jgi:hypothetical protein
MLCLVGREIQPDVRIVLQRGAAPLLNMTRDNSRFFIIFQRLEREEWLGVRKMPSSWVGEMREIATEVRVYI